MNINRAKRVIQRAIERQTPVMVWGAPGIGKSSVIKQIAIEMGYPKNFGFVDLRLPQLDPTDLRGIPVPNREEGVCNWFIPEFMPTKGKGILFLDEMEKAIPAVKNAALQLVLDRQLGTYTLPPGWAIVAAGNREEDGAFSQPLGSALANRMMHIETECDFESWLGWARRSGISTDILGFIEFRKMEALCPPMKVKAGASKSGRLNAFPTPRTWEMASRLIDGINDMDERRTLVSASVGEAMSNDFITWDQYFRAVDPKGIIERGEMPDKKHMKEIHARYAITISCAAHLGAMDIKAAQKHVKNVVQFVDKYLTPDVKVVFFRNIPKSHSFIFTKYPNIMKAVQDVLDLAQSA